MIADPRLSSPLSGTNDLPDDPVRMRVRADPQVTWAEMHPSTAGEGTLSELSVVRSSSGGWSLPHPGDVVYWLLCLACFSLLLLAVI